MYITWPIGSGSSTRLEQISVNKINNSVKNRKVILFIAQIVSLVNF